MVRVGREVRSRTDYILGKYRCIFKNLAVRDPRHNSDHYLVLGCLHSSPLREQNNSLRRRKRIPLRPPPTPTREDGLFAALRRAIPKPKPWESRKNEWILVATWRIVDKRVFARWYLARYQSHIWRLGSAINASLKEDRLKGTQEAGEELDRLLRADPPLHKES